MNSELYNIINKKKLDIVSESIEKAHGLPNECYLNGPYTKIERKKIFEDRWVTIGVASSVPNPGDTKPFDLLGIPLIIIRDKNHKVRVFHNVCSHRGYKLIHENIMKINLVGKVRDFDQKHLLIDFKNNSEKHTFDHSIAQGMLNMNDLNTDSCVEISERFNFNSSHIMISYDIYNFYEPFVQKNIYI